MSLSVRLSVCLFLSEFELEFSVSVCLSLSETKATCRHTVPYVMGEYYSALSRPGKVQSTQVSHNRQTQHSTDSIARPLSASHWSGASRDTVFTNTPTTQVCRLLLLTTGLRWCRVTGRLLHLHLLGRWTVEDASVLAVSRTTSVSNNPSTGLRHPSFNQCRI